VSHIVSEVSTYVQIHVLNLTSNKLTITQITLVILITLITRRTLITLTTRMTLITLIDVDSKLAKVKCI